MTSVRFQRAMKSSHLRAGVRIVGLFLLLLAAGCVKRETAPPGGPPVTGATQGAVVGVEPAIQPATPPTAPSAMPPTAPSATRPTDQSIAKSGPPAAKPPVPAKAPEKSPASPATTEPPKKEPAAPPPVKQPASPPLDLASLEQRLRDTKAIGVFTKLSLKNQVDDLLSQFRTFHEGGAGAALTDLRERYNLLLLKVLSLLQGSDPMLAQAIAGSREAIWGVLVDPAKFAKLST
jgi:hypothetical protein